MEVVKLPEAKRGFVLLPRRWVVERSFAWTTRFRRLVRDYERLPATLAGLHLVVFACLMLHQWLSISPPQQALVSGVREPYEWPPRLLQVPQRARSDQCQARTAPQASGKTCRQVDLPMLVAQ